MRISKEADIKKILKHSKTIAVVGASAKPGRDSGVIAQFLNAKKYKVYAVNPAYQEVFGLKCYPSLKAIPEHIDIVDIFRNPDEVMPIVEEAIQIGANTIWFQLGVVNEEAAQRADSVGMNVIMDRCIAIEYRNIM